MVSNYRMSYYFYRLVNSIGYLFLALLDGMTMKIADREIGLNNPPYIIAEASCNHCGKLENAIKLIKAAKRAGADAVKFQAYTAETLTIDCNKVDFIAQSGLWKGRTLYELYKKAETPFEWFPTLFKVANDEKIEIFASVFDFGSVDLLERLGCKVWKIASFEIVDIPLIRYAYQTGKPLIISTGLASDGEILEANDAAVGHAAFLHCTSEYPGTVEQANLGRMLHINHLLKYENHVGISDHTRGDVVPIAATALRAAIIEKHIKLSTDEKSEDSEFSMEPGAFKFMVTSVKMTHEALQDRPVSKEGRQFRRSLYAIRDIKRGDIYSLENIRSIRPGYGLPPKMLSNLLGKKSKRDWRRGDPLS